jgi:hypothetical protein
VSPLATLAGLADRLGDCGRHPPGQDCLICTADAFIDLGFRAILDEVIRNHDRST